jgi:glycosyltransferase involved in cell wall biosynthesis
MWSIVYFLEYITSYITTHFVCVSSADVATGKKLLPGFNKKHSIIRAAVEWDIFYKPARIAPSFPKPTEPFVFGTIACFKPQKNLFDLLTAFKYMHRQVPHTRLEIIGDGQQRQKIERWITEKKLCSIITLHGWQEHVAPIMERWHAFVLSSLWEGLPCAIVEARLLQLPILSYNTGGIADVIQQNVNGLLFEQHDWVGLAHGMLELARTKLLFKTLQPLQEDLQHFMPKHMVQQHIQLYNQTSH